MDFPLSGTALYTKPDCSIRKFGGIITPSILHAHDAPKICSGSHLVALVSRPNSMKMDRIAPSGGKHGSNDHYGRGWPSWQGWCGGAPLVIQDDQDGCMKMEEDKPPVKYQAS